MMSRNGHSLRRWGLLVCAQLWVGQWWWSLWSSSQQGQLLLVAASEAAPAMPAPTTEVEEAVTETIVCPPPLSADDLSQGFSHASSSSSSLPTWILAGLTANWDALNDDTWNLLLHLSCQLDMELHVLSRGAAATQRAQARFVKAQQQCFAGQHSCRLATFTPDPAAAKTTPNRIDRLGLLRNYQRDKIANRLANATAAELQQVVIVSADLDLSQLPTLAALQHSAQHIQEGHSSADVICAAGIMYHPYGYYDIFATVFADGTFAYPLSGRINHTTLQPHENASLVRSNDIYGMVTQARLLQYFVDQQDDDDKPVPVQSCFGGLALYRASAWLTPTCRYAEQAPDDNEYDWLSNRFDGRPCEHVLFHECLSVRVAVQPQLRTVWEDAPVIRSSFAAGGRVALGPDAGLVHSSVLPAALHLHLQHGPYRTVIHARDSFRITRLAHPDDSEDDDSDEDVVVWQSPVPADEPVLKEEWLSTFLTLNDVTGALELSYQHAGNCTAPSRHCFQAASNATHCAPCLTRLWHSSNAKHLPPPYTVHLGADGVLRVLSGAQGGGDSLQVVWQSHDEAEASSAVVDLRAALSDLEPQRSSSAACISSGTHKDIQRVLDAGGPFAHAVLCPGAVFDVRATIVLKEPHQRLYTQGWPENDDDNKATLRLASAGVACAVRLQGRHAVLSHVVVNGNRPELGGATSDAQRGQALIVAGGTNAAGHTVEHVTAYDTRSWSTLHVTEGEAPWRCRGSVVQHNRILNAGLHYRNDWADGISMACQASVVRHNFVRDATDVAIVLFGAPGSVVEHNVIVSETRSINGGITLVDYEPHHGNFTHSRVQYNDISVNGTIATMIVGISMGLRTWVSLTEEETWNRLLDGGTVASNVVRNPHGQILFPLALDGVANWTVVNNTVEQPDDQEFPGRPAAFQYNATTCLNCTLQDDFVDALDSTAIEVVLSSWAECLEGGTDETLNEYFAAETPYLQAVLCPGAVFDLHAPVRLTAPHQALLTHESDEDDNQKAVLRLANATVATAVDLTDLDFVRLSHVVVDGNVHALGQAHGNDLYGQGLIRAGGRSRGASVQHVEVRNPRSWTAMHVLEGPAGGGCRGARLQDNGIHVQTAKDDDSGMHPHAVARPTNGLSLACPNSVVERTVVTNATDVGMIVFGAPGSILQDNRVERSGGTAALSMVEYDPFGGDYTGTTVRRNHFAVSGSAAAIAMGVGATTTRHDDDDDAVLRKPLRGGAVTDNVIQVRSGGAMGMVADGVQNWTVTGNRVEGVGGQKVSTDKLLELNRDSCSGMFQDEFATTTEDDEVTVEGPKLAWLASFPNSGTSYTLQAVRHATNVSCATNYGAETKGEMALVYPEASLLESPFWLPPAFRVQRPQAGYVLTKTHCGSRCPLCAPPGYLTSPETFWETCFETHVPQFDSDEEVVLQNKVQAGTYDAQRVQKVVHLVRDPLDNVVSRFHHARKSHRLQDIPKTADGFLQYCQQSDAHSHSNATVLPIADRELWAEFKTVPCHADFVRYVNWHNLVFQQTRRLDSLVVHYEEYERPETLQSVIRFLEQTPLPTDPTDVVPFEAGKTYRHYFQDHHVRIVVRALETLATPETWHHLQRYFVVPNTASKKNKDGLGISLLLSFPNSGTSYTLQAVRHETGVNSATNYGGETKGELAPVLTKTAEDDSSSPYWLPPANRTDLFRRPADETTSSSLNILTKTHCAGYDFVCQSSACYDMSDSAFGQSCREVRGGGPPTAHYDANAVQSLVHLVRHPLDNIVSRFHLQHKVHLTADERLRYPKNATGFRDFCQERVDVYRPPVYEDVYQLLQGVPCHNDFLKYVYWHNRAFAMAGDSTPVQVIRYERYETHWNQTMGELVEFLGQERNETADSHAFEPGKTYHDFYTETEIQILREVLERLSSPTTWRHLRPYFRPRVDIAWLLSFPNSGTSYTLHAVRRESNVSAATNYGAETKGEYATVFESSGPYWLPRRDFERPAEGLILTKTHCGSGDDDMLCQEAGCFEKSQEQFVQECLQVHRTPTNRSTASTVKHPSYSMVAVKKAVHLIRDPFDNVVSRFNNERKVRFGDDWRYPATPQGFRAFCAEQVDLVRPASIDEEVWQDLRNVPCRNDFVKYVLWHNRAFALAQHKGSNPLETLVVHYEDYETAWNETVSSVLNFLEQPRNKAPHKPSHAFEAGKTYRDTYFSPDEIQSVQRALQALASPETWRHLQARYVDEATSTVAKEVRVDGSVLAAAAELAADAAFALS